MIGCSPDPFFPGTFRKNFEGKCVRLESANFRNQFMRSFDDTTVWIKPVGEFEPMENFNIISGLSGAPGTVSFQSQLFPNSYLTNKDGLIFMQDDPEVIYATWLVSGGMFKVCDTNDNGWISSEYQGTINYTQSGKTCQKWSSQEPHEHNRTPDAYPEAGLDDNYCRNPDGEDGAWCYTTDPETRFELCKCEETFTINSIHGMVRHQGFRLKESSLADADSLMYKDSSFLVHECSKPKIDECAEGTHKCDLLATCVDTEESYYCTCPYGFIGSGIVGETRDAACALDPNVVGNFLKNNQGSCIRLEAVNLPNYFIGNREDNSFVIQEEFGYMANFNIVAGLSGAPGTASFQSQQSPEYYLMNKDGLIWLEKEPQDIFATWLVTDGLWSVEGDDTVTINSVNGVIRHQGFRLKEQTNDETDSLKRDASFIVRPCDIPVCDTNAKGYISDSYRGTIDHSESGNKCQSWSSQEPHNHDRTPDAYPDAGLKGNNYCRNPDGEAGAWCYTTDPNSRWEYCKCATGTWVEVYSQNNPSEDFKDCKLGACKLGKIGGANFINFDIIENLAEYHFQLVWNERKEENGEDYALEWKQKQNPLSQFNTDMAPTEVHLVPSGASPTPQVAFRGLSMSHASDNTLLDGTVDGYWWFSVGYRRHHIVGEKSGNPAYWYSPDGKLAQKTQLFAFVPQPADVQSFEKVDPWIIDGTQNELLGTTSLYKNWQMTFDFKPSGKQNDWSTFVHLTDDATGALQRVFSFFCIPDSFATKSFAEINGAGQVSGWDYDLIYENEWNTFFVAQVVKNEEFVIAVTINGKIYEEVVNRTPQDYKTINIYAARNYAASKGSLRNFKIVTSSDNFAIHRKFYV